MNLLNKMAEASHASRVLGIGELEKKAWEKLGYRVWIPDLIGTSSEYLAPYQQNGFNHPNRDEQRKAWKRVKRSSRWVNVRPLMGGTYKLQVSQILNEILSLMKKDSVFAASLMDAFSGMRAFQMLEEEGIVYDKEIKSKMQKYFNSTL